VIVACRPGSESALWFLRELVRSDRERPVIVLSDGSPNGFVRRAFEAGADDVLVLDVARGDALVAQQLHFALEKAVARRTGGSSAGTALGSMICVLGPKGGIGKTLTSANLGVALATAGRKVAIVDLDLQFGDVGLSLGLTPQRTIYDLIKSGGSLDVEKVEAYLTPHPTGARVLVAPVRPDQASAVTIEFLRELYPLLRASHDFVVVDTPPGFSPEVIASIDSSTDVCLVGMLDSLSLKNTKLGLETLELMGYERQRIRIVLNRADTNVGVTVDDVVAIVGSRPDVAVPSHRDVVRSINEGSPIVLSRARSETAKAFRALAAAYLGQGAHDNGRRRLRRRKG
jgi:pilus assembly protein CpaE